MDKLRYNRSFKNVVAVLSVLGVLHGSIVVLAGISLIQYTGLVLEMKPVEAVIVDIELNRNRKGPDTQKIDISYIVDGAVYSRKLETDTPISFPPGLVANYSVGDTIKIYYDPENPEVIASPRSAFVAIIVGGFFALFAIPAICTNVSIIKNHRRFLVTQEEYDREAEEHKARKARKKTPVVLICVGALLFATLFILGIRRSQSNNVTDATIPSDQIDSYRDEYNLGTCKELSGDVSVALFYMEDFESSWTNEEMEQFTHNEVEPALAFLEREALKYGIYLDLHISIIYENLFYDGEVVTNSKETGTVSSNTLSQVANRIGFSNTTEMLYHFRTQYQTDEVICFTIFNKNGNGYGINPPRRYVYDIDEHCVLFAQTLYPEENIRSGSQASIIACDTLYLFGAESFYSNADRKRLAKKYFPSDIMLTQQYDVRYNTIDEVTAFYIGWTDDVPEILLNKDWN